MLGNEPVMQDRSPEDQIFAIEAEMKNLMEEYQVAARSGDQQRADAINNQIEKLQDIMIEIQNEMSNEGRGDTYNLSTPNLYNLRLRQSLESGDPDEIRKNQEDIKRSALQDIQSIEMSGMMEEYPNDSAKKIEELKRYSMANGDEVKKGGPLGLGIIDAIRGGVGSAFTDPMSAQNYAMNAMKGRMKQDEPTIREMFEKEFKQARMEGKEIFEFMGKMYNTKTAEEVQGMSRGGEFPDLTGDRQVTQADILKGRGVYAQGGLAGNVGKISVEDNKMIQRAIETKPSDIGHTVQMLKNILVKKYPYIPETEINVILSKGVEDYSVRPPVPGMANGGEAIGDELEGMEMSEEQAMAEVGVAEKEMQMIQQLVAVVQKLIAEGISEKDLIAFLKEQGLDDEDIDGLMQMVLQSQGSQDPEGIDQQIAGMM